MRIRGLLAMLRYLLSAKHGNHAFQLLNRT
ncbi:terminal protein [Bacillus phage BSTP6]|uniref:Terminal protein n=2 Tax=Salasvirus phi29 TaxID=10756 RepID=A0A889INY7_9CAUD|nr:single-stranded DNA-binding protein [Bacillus phage BSTP4]QRD99833.1 terminal protein [Bacillus phage BSTP6]